ncbi:hypothetical protein [Lysinibacillus mangiferihumi]|uniref:hypothetical protein n=1 Tax=Lysinibacillus mangiferihumi TaxID=1130819 RepID=UPI00142D5D50|nr:hypothetical protein [Lysinibacillus mangiferihumi]
MSEQERENLKAKEQRKNPGGALNSASAQVHTGSPSKGCLVNIGSNCHDNRYYFVGKSMCKLKFLTYKKGRYPLVWIVYFFLG